MHLKPFHKSYLCELQALDVCNYSQWSWTCNGNVWYNIPEWWKACQLPGSGWRCERSTSLPSIQAADCWSKGKNVGFGLGASLCVSRAEKDHERCTEKHRSWWERVSSSRADLGGKLIQYEPLDRVFSSWWLVSGNFLKAVQHRSAGVLMLGRAVLNSEHLPPKTEFVRLRCLKYHS